MNRCCCAPASPTPPHPPCGHLLPQAGRRERERTRSQSHCFQKQKPPEGGFCKTTAMQRIRAAYFANRFAIAAPKSPGDFTVVTPAFSIAANLPSAVPEPPEAIAP